MLPRADDVVQVDLDSFHQLHPLQQKEVARQLGFTSVDMIPRAEWEGL